MELTKGVLSKVTVVVALSFFLMMILHSRSSLGMVVGAVTFLFILPFVAKWLSARNNA